MSSDAATKTRTAERTLLAIGLALIAFWIAARLDSVIGSKTAVARFEAGDSANGGNATQSIDFSLWSPKRILAYRDSVAAGGDVPLAILRISRIGLQVPVFDGTEELTLNRGVGRIRGTAQVGEVGNLGIAGHRDGFFRRLQDIAVGDILELVQRRHTDRYTVSEIRIVAPEDTSVLDPSAVPTLTLVTCFPFYFVGHAPKRYVVKAVIASPRQSDFGGHENTVSMGSTTKNDKEKK